MCNETKGNYLQTKLVKTLFKVHVDGGCKQGLKGIYHHVSVKTKKHLRRSTTLPSIKGLNLSIYIAPNKEKQPQNIIYHK